MTLTLKPDSQWVAPGRSESFVMESHVLAMRILVHKLAALCESIAENKKSCDLKMDGKSLDFDLAAMVTVLVAVRVCQRQRRRMKRRRKSVWVRRIFWRRCLQGEYHNLVQEMRLADPANHLSYLRMLKETFDSLLQKVSFKFKIWIVSVRYFSVFRGFQGHYMLLILLYLGLTSPST